MQKQIRIIKQNREGKGVVYGISIKREIAIFAEGIHYEAQWQNGDILLASGTNLKPDDKQVETYDFKECKIEVNSE